MNNPTALIVEDEYDISVIFAKALEAAGFKTEVAYAGDAALRWLSSATPDVVVLDLNLPNVPGAAILQHIRTDARLTGTKVIVATAYPDMADVDIHDDADCVLCKPVSFSQMRDLAKRFAPSGGQHGPAANT